jgi:hypothetical protein
MEFDIWTILAMLALPFVAIWIAINIKKRINKKSVKKWAFFHPFWYSMLDIAMMEEVEKRSCGALSRHWLKRRRIKLLCIVWTLKKLQFWRKLM